MGGTKQNGKGIRLKLKPLVKFTGNPDIRDLKT
jgi:hypothetical protein